MSKEAISKNYIEEWHEITRDYLPAEHRSAMIVGSNRRENIGARIAAGLRSASFKTHEVDKKGDPAFDAAQHAQETDFTMFDTLVLANGETYIDWIENQPPQMIYSVLRNKLFASMVASSEFVRQTLSQDHLKYIVFIGSMAGSAVLNGSAAYCAACAGLNHYARCLAWELAPKGYRVFILNPSNVEGTPMTEKTIRDLMSYRELSRDEAEEYWGAVRALPRWLSADEIGEIVASLVTFSEMEWLCGTPLNLGGGLR